MTAERELSAEEMRDALMAAFPHARVRIAEGGVVLFRVMVDGRTYGGTLEQGIRKAALIEAIQAYQHAMRRIDDMRDEQSPL